MNHFMSGRRPLNLSAVARFRLSIVLALSLVLLSSGCGTLQLEAARTAHLSGDNEKALEILSIDGIPAKDRILALMEKGLLQHQMGDYQGSSQSFLAVTSLLRRYDYVSVNEQLSSLSINEWTKTYKGEYAERLWVHTYQMINFLMLDKPESAAVEARQAWKLFDQYGGVLQQAHFTRALMALVFEQVNLFNDARVEYRKLSKLSAISYTPEDFARVSAEKQNNEGEVVLFVATGNYPIKTASYADVEAGYGVSVPVYEHLFAPNTEVRIESDGSELSAVMQVESDLVHLANHSLSARMLALSTRHVVRSGVKYALAGLIEASTDSKTAGEVSKALLFGLEVADLRGWSGLPGQLSLLRLRLPVGLHNLTIDLKSTDGQSIGQVALHDLTVSARKPVFRSVRF